jgi:tetratricopeptide (TPR) repeat protein
MAVIKARLAQISPATSSLCVVACFLISVGLCFSSVSDCHRVVFSQQSSMEHSAGQDRTFQNGLIALRENRLDDALDALTKAEHEHPKDARIRNFRGIVLARLGQTTEAAGEYEEAIRLDPQTEDAYRNLGFLEWTQHRLARAKEVLEQALKLSSNDSFAHYYLGRVQLDAGLYSEAFRELELSGVPWPSEPDFLIQIATGHVALGKQEEARKALRQLETFPLGDSQSAHVASLFLAVHENDKAVELLRKASDRQHAGLASWAQFDLALTYLLSGSYEQAAQQAHIYIGLVPSKDSKASELASAWSLIGIAEARLGRADLAVEALRQAAKLAPSEEEVWLNLTRELMELSRFADAISATQEGVASNPESYALRLRLGAGQLAAGRYAAAEDIFRALVVAGDPLPTSYIGLAQVLLRQGRAEEAASVLETGQQKIGANFLLSYFLGLSLDRAGKRLDAFAAFREAVRLNPKSAEAHLGIGKTELALGRAKDAIAELQETLRLSPGDIRAQRLLTQAYRRAGDTQSATEHADAPSDIPPPAEGDLLGDFLPPQWKMPSAD